MKRGKQPNNSYSDNSNIKWPLQTFQLISVSKMFSSFCALLLNGIPSDKNEKSFKFLFTIFKLN